MTKIKVDAAVEVFVNAFPLIDDTDFKTRETAVAYNAAGMDLVWNFQTPDGAVSQTAVTPTTSGSYDWTHVGDGMYKIEIPASGGASINNDTEGVGWFTGIATGVLPWASPRYEFVPANISDSLVKGTDKLQVDLSEISGSAVSTTTAQLGVNIVQISGDSVAADNLESYTDGTTPMPVNATQISGDATAADNAEAFFDGTGYAGTNNVIPTVTAVTTVNGLAANVITAAAIATDAIDADAIAASAVTEIQSGLSTLSAADVSGAVWNAETASYGTAGTYGALVETNLDAAISSRLATAGYTAPDNASITSILSDTNELQTDWVNGGRLDLILDAVKAVADKLDTALELDVAVYRFTANALEQAPSSGLDAAGVRSAVGLASANLDTQLAALPTAAENATELLDQAAGVETNRTVRQALRLMLASLAGKLSGAATTTVVIRDTNDGKDRITATVDADGNRTAITYDAS